MGEKERSVSAAEDPGARRFSEYTPAGEDGPGSGGPEPAEGKPSKEQRATNREVGLGMATQRAPGGISHEDDWHDQARVGVNDVDGDEVPELSQDKPTGDAVERQTPKRDFGDRMGAGGNIEDDPGGGGPATDTTIIKSKSNITNN